MSTRNLKINRNLTHKKREKTRRRPGLLPRCLCWSSAHYEHLGAGAVSRLGTQFVWCELYDMRDVPKTKI